MNIYVGNLSYEVSEDDLQKLFQEYGQVDSVSVIKDNLTGQSKGFGFVEMPNHDEAQRAMDSLNGKTIQGRALTVNEARPRAESAGGHGGRGGAGGGRGRY